MNRILSIKVYQKIFDDFMGNLKIFISFYPKGSIRNTNIYLFQVDFSIKKHKKMIAIIHQSFSITNNKPIIGFYKGFQHF